MRASAARSLPRAEELRSLIERVAHGIAAERFRPHQNVVLLPHAANLDAGEAYLTWSAGIAVAPGTEVTWSYHDRTGNGAGTATVHLAGAPTGQWPTGAGAPRVMKARAAVEDGNQALWELLAKLERFVRERVEASNRYIARELEDRLGDGFEGWAPVDNRGVIDEVAIDEVATALLYGTAGAKDSVVIRMVRRAATTSINNQPLGSWFDRNITARADEYIRRRIGDPHVGRKVRRIMRTASPRSFAELQEAYSRAHPKDHIGRERLLAALSAGKTIDAVSSSIDLFVEAPTGADE